jgi:hypothetical protein
MVIGWARERVAGWGFAMTRDRERLGLTGEIVDVSLMLALMAVVERLQLGGERCHTSHVTRRDAFVVSFSWSGVMMLELW